MRSLRLVLSEKGGSVKVILLGSFFLSLLSAQNVVVQPDCVQNFTFTANGSTTAYNAIDGMLTKYVGPAETLPSNNNISIIDITLARAGFRW